MSDMPITSPRIERFRWLAAEVVRVEALPDGKAQEEELEALGKEAGALCKEVWATPVRGPIDVLERAFAALRYLGRHSWQPQRRARDVL